MLAPAPHIETLKFEDGRIIQFYWLNARVVLLRMDSLPRKNKRRKLLCKTPYV